MSTASAENIEISASGLRLLRGWNPSPALREERPACDHGAALLACEELLQGAILHHLAGELAQAERLYRRILIEQPRHAQACHNLGLVALHTGHTAAALAHFQTALLADPRQGQYWLSCIDALLQDGQTDSARKIFSHAIKQGLKGAPAKGMAARLKARSNSGKSAESASLRLLEQYLFHGRPAEAERLARVLVGRYPADGRVWKALGAALDQLNRLPESVAAMTRAAQVLPSDAEVLRILAVCLIKAGRIAEAEIPVRAALVLDINSAPLYCYLGATLLSQERFAESEEASRKALELDPTLNAARSNRGIALVRLGRWSEGEALCRLATEIDPHFAEAQINLGSALEMLGRCVEAGVSWRRALDLNPDARDAHSAWLFSLSHDIEISPEALFAEHLHFGERFEKPLLSTWRKHGNVVDPDRPLNIGFVSGDFHEHAVMSFIGTVLQRLSERTGFRLHAYSAETREDATARRLRGYFHGWRKVNGIADESLAEIIRADGIDILVDLSGHTRGNRMQTFARKPAPIQCAWLGYLGTSGLTSIDYYFADKLFLPPGEFDRFFTEQLSYLSAVGAFEPYAGAPPCNALPALTNGYVTFGSFARGGKLTRNVVALWSRLLRALPDAKMLLGAMPVDGNCEPLTTWFAEEGIAVDRFFFEPRCGVAEYLALHHRIDICLDPFPFTGATTTCHAMWMGVPTLTLEGSTVPGRLGPAMLKHAGVADFVARSLDDFVDKGIHWAQDIEALSRLRANLREQLRASSLCNAALVADTFADSLREMWKGWCGTQPSQD